jgi:hypothetical protein
MRPRMMFAAFCAAMYLASAAGTASAQTAPQPCTPIYSVGVKELIGCLPQAERHTCTAIIIVTVFVPERIASFLPGSPIRVVIGVVKTTYKQATYRAVVGYKNGCVPQPGFTKSKKKLPYPVQIKPAKKLPLYLGGPLRLYRRHHEQWLQGYPGRPCNLHRDPVTHQLVTCKGGPTP